MDLSIMVARMPAAARVAGRRRAREPGTWRHVEFGRDEVLLCVQRWGAAHFELAHTFGNYFGPMCRVGGAAYKAWFLEHLGGSC